jgi:PTH1 family peptidyl-tRNA hydrolase
MADDARWLVIGLGNPGLEYAATRHNAGYLVVDELASRIGGKFSAHKSRADVLEGRVGVGHDALRVILAKPRTYMNESGGPVSALVSFFKIPLDHVIVIHDELDLPFETLRIKDGGGDNGHNGLKSLTKSLGSANYLRVRFGIGRPQGSQDPADFVLKPFSSVERPLLSVNAVRAADAVETLMRLGLEETQQRFN